MKGSKLVAGVVLAVVTAAVPASTLGQSLPPPGGGLTLEQYVGLQERVDAFCLYLDTNMKLERPLPEGDLSIPGVGAGQYVYTAAEVKALIPHCAMLTRLIQSVVDATRRQQ